MNEKSDVWCLGAVLLEFNLEKAKSSYSSNAGNKDPIRFGLKLRASSFDFLWDALSYQTGKRPDAKTIAESMDMLITQSSSGIRTMTLCDDMILWCSMQIPLLSAWTNLAMKLQVQSVIPLPYSFHQMIIQWTSVLFLKLIWMKLLKQDAATIVARKESLMEDWR